MRPVFACAWGVPSITVDILPRNLRCQESAGLIHRGFLVITLLLLSLGVWPSEAIAEDAWARSPTTKIFHGPTPVVLMRTYERGGNTEGFKVEEFRTERRSDGAWTTHVVLSYALGVPDTDLGQVSFDLSGSHPDKCDPCMYRRTDIKSPGSNVSDWWRRDSYTQSMASAFERVTAAVDSDLSKYTPPVPDRTIHVRDRIHAVTPVQWLFLAGTIVVILTGLIARQFDARVNYIRLIVAMPLFAIAGYLLLVWKLTYGEGAPNSIAFVWAFAMAIGGISLLLALWLAFGAVRREL